VKNETVSFPELFFLFIYYVLYYTYTVSILPLSDPEVKTILKKFHFYFWSPVIAIAAKDLRKKIKKNEVKNGDWSLGILLTNVAHRDGDQKKVKKLTPFT
jgi:hypothetical protein